MSEEIVYAIHNFVAENEDEITFSMGEPIVVLEKDEKYMDGWWQGRNVQGNVGLFPMNYTSPVKSTLTPPTLSTSFSSPLSTNSSRSSRSFSQRPASYTLEDQIDNTISHVASDAQTPSLPTSSSKSSPRSSYTHAPNMSQTPAPPTSTANLAPPPPDSPTISLTSFPMPIARPSSSNVSTTPESWTIDQVADWLRSVGLDNVVDTFIEQEITGDILMDLTVDSLKELGISAFGRRYKVMNAIEKLKAQVGQHGKSNDEVKPVLSTLELPANTSTPPRRVASGESSMSVSPPSSPIDSDNIYQFPRKAPLPPLGSALDGNDRTSRPRHPTMLTDVSSSPMSPRSLASSSVSRSNTFQTTSSKISTSSSSSSTFMSREKSPVSMNTIRHASSQKSIGPDTTEKDTLRHELPDTQPQQAVDGLLKDSTVENHHHFISPVPRDRNMSVASIDHQALAQYSDSQAPDYEGWLHKQGDKYKTWNKRWFVLKGPNLFYFKSPKDVRMKGIIHLRGYRVLVDDSVHPSKYSFKAQHEHERTFYFYTDSKESMRTWIKMLMKATITRDFGAPVMSSNHAATVSLDAARRMRPRPPSTIMFKTHPGQGPHPGSQVPTMAILPEEKDNDRLMPGHPFESAANKQTRESGIVEYPHAVTDGSLNEAGTFHFGPDGTSPIMQPTRENAAVASIAATIDEDEDLIDPQHGPTLVPPGDRSLTQSPFLPANHFTGPRSSTLEESHQEESQRWDKRQYIEWINRNLPDGKHVVDLSSAFRNGDTLILLLESLSGKSVRRSPTMKGGSVSMMMLDNIVAAFKFMGREGVVVDGRYTIKDIFSGDEDKIIDMLDTIREWSENITKQPSVSPSHSSSLNNA